MSTAAQKAVLSTSPFFYSVPLQKSDFSATIEGSESSLAQQNNPIQIRWFIERMPPLPATSMHPEERMLRHLLTHLATKNSPMQIAQGRCFLQGLARRMAFPSILLYKITHILPRCVKDGKLLVIESTQFNEDFT